MSTRFEGRDFLELRQEMISFMKERLGSDWTDQGESDDLMIMIEMLAYLSDNLHYYIDAQKRESDIVTATRERNVVQKATRDGYKPHMFVAASGFVTISFQDPTTNDITIPKGTIFQTEDAEIPEDNMRVVALEEHVIPAGSLYYDIEVYEGSLVTEIFTRADITESGYLRLASERTATGHTTMKYRNRVWEEVEDVYTDFRVGALFSTHTKYFKDSTTTIVQLPYNWTRYITNQEPIEVEYLLTSGADGNISEERITRVNSVIRDSTGKDVTGDMEITNLQPIQGGLNRESVPSIKTNYKASIRSLETLITLPDYEDFVRIFTGQECIAVDWRTAPQLVTDAHVIRIFVDLNSMQRERLLEELKGRQGRSDIIEVYPPLYKDYIIRARCWLNPVGDTIETITRNINEIIDYEYKELPQRGKAHVRSYIISMIHRASSRISRVELLEPTEDIVPDSYELPRYLDIQIDYEVVS